MTTIAEEPERYSWRRLARVLLSGFQAAPLTAVLVAVMSIITAAASVCYSLGFRLVIDGAIAHAGGKIALGSVLVAGLFTLSWVLAIVGGAEGTMLTDRTNLVLGVRIAKLASKLPTLEHFERSDLLAKLERLTSSRRTLAGSTRQMVSLFGQLLRAIGIVVLLATVYLPILVVPFLALAPALSDRWAARLQRRSDQALAEDRRMLADLFSLATSADTARELRTYGISDALIARHDALTDHVRRRAVRAALLSALLEGLGWVVFAAGVVAAIVLLVLRAAHGHVSPGSVVMAVSLMRRAQTQVSRSTDTASAFNTSVAAAGDLLWLEDHAASFRRPDLAGTGTSPESSIPARLQTGILLEGLTFAYPGGEGGELALGPIDLLLPAGKTIAVVGENGAGKTTLVKLLSPMYRPTAGRITVDGVDLAALDPVQWREHITAAFQDFQRLQLILAESVGVGDIGRVGDHEAVGSALGRAGAAALTDELPDGMLTRVGNRFTGGRELSGGQWQRLALARGLMRETPLLTVLDEPTAALDAPTETALFERYAAAAQELAERNGAITLLVSHRFSTVRAADLIVVLDHGQLVESGTHQQLMAAGGTYAELFALQARAYA
jgi:ATP-binding cassette, subfamily B, bacterial